MIVRRKLALTKMRSWTRIWFRWKIRSLPWQNLVISSVCPWIISRHRIAAAAVFEVCRSLTMTTQPAFRWRKLTTTFCSLQIRVVRTWSRFMRFRNPVVLPAVLPSSTWFRFSRKNVSLQWSRRRNWIRNGLSWWRPRTVPLRRRRLPNTEMYVRTVFLLLP